MDIDGITKYIFLEPNPQKADLAIVFGTRFNEPVEIATDLYKQKIISKILVTGGINKRTGENEAERIGRELKKQGIKEDDIFIENKSNNTLENVLFSKKIIEEKIGLKNIKNILAIVKSHHARRALMTLKRQFPKPLKFSCVTYEAYGFTKDDWFSHEIGKKKVSSEYEKIKKYLKKGDIEEL